MKRQAFAFLGLVTQLSLVSPLAFAKPASDAQLKSEVETTSLQYFIDNANPTTGLVRDQADNFTTTPLTNEVASMAATGFGLTVIVNAATRGMLTKKYAEDYALKTLRFSRDHVARRKGWFLHFINWQTGARTWHSEYSTIDTALFLAGALYAAQVFPNSEIADIANKLYEETDFWDAMTDGGTLPNKRTITMAYFDGYTSAQWDMYAEHMILLILGLGHPTHPLPPETWLAWNRRLTHGPSARDVMGFEAPLFIHQYSQLFIDFRQFKDPFRNYHDNAAEMTRYHRQMPQVVQNYKTLKAGFWGFSAGEAPQNSYRVYNAIEYSSTVCLGCVAGSAMYMPHEILSDIRGWISGSYRDEIWGKYGLTDSIDLDQNWFSPVVLGITVGPEYLSFANAEDSTSVWKYFMRIPAIKHGLEAASSVSSMGSAPQNLTSSSAH